MSVLSFLYIFLDSTYSAAAAAAAILVPLTASPLARRRPVLGLSTLVCLSVCLSGHLCIHTSQGLESEQAEPFELRITQLLFLYF